MKTLVMLWTKRLLLLSPFTVPVVLPVLLSLADRLDWHREHIAGYGFLFAAPLAWLLDHDWLNHLQTHWHSHWLSRWIGYVILLWIPALLYSGCLWLLLRGIRFLAARRSRVEVH
jgi:hypothetical protein